MMRLSELKSLVRGVLLESYPTMKMEEIWRDEGLEATTLEDAAEMYAYDLGYQGLQALPMWMIDLAKERRIDLISSFEQGRQDRIG